MSIEYLYQSSILILILMEAIFSTLTQLKGSLSIILINTQIISCSKKKKSSRAEFVRNNRMLDGSASEYSIETGYMYQIDSTICDIFVVDCMTRSVNIGCPTVYFVIDVFSRLIVGFNVTLENASYGEALIAISSIVSDKVKLCEEHDIEISRSKWPNSEFPSVLVAGNAELKGQLAEPLMKMFGISVENTVAYRPDQKGVVERQFNSLNTYLRGLVLGQKYWNHGRRGAKDYSEDAVCTLDELKKHIIRFILNHNNTVIDGYVTNEELFSDKVPLVPSNIWIYYMGEMPIHRFSAEYIIMHLMYPEKASVERSGIRFKGLLYTAPKEERWKFHKYSKAYKINIRYDPRNMNAVFIPRENGEIVRAELKDSFKFFKDKTFSEIKKLKEVVKKMNVDITNENHLFIQKMISSIIDEGKASKKSRSNMYSNKKDTNRRNKEKKMSKRLNHHSNQNEVLVKEIKKESEDSLHDSMKQTKLDLLKKRGR